MTYLANLEDAAARARDDLGELGKAVKAKLCKEELTMLRHTWSRISLVHRGLHLIAMEGSTAPKPSATEVGEALGAIPTLAGFKDKVAQLKPHQLEALILLIDKLDLEVE